MIYRPPKPNLHPIAQDAKMGVKFSNDMMIARYLCDQWKIPYEESDLEDSMIGPALRIKKE